MALPLLPCLALPQPCLRLGFASCLTEPSNVPLPMPLNDNTNHSRVQPCHKQRKLNNHE